jgi:dTDP-4-amino-4,6-dideoxygalactose transaminase
MQDRVRVQGWLREHFPHHQYLSVGVSGATLLYDALKTTARAFLVLPAFICPNLSAMAAAAGKHIVHVDVDPLTLHPDMAILEATLARLDVSDSVLLIDHSFGYPFPGLCDLKGRFPKLLIIEDCARALGAQINGQSPGVYSDWLLLSMYKTIPGSHNGAVLLAKTPLGIGDARKMAPTVRERAATSAPLRFVYDLLLRRRADIRARPDGLISSAWIPDYGSPSDLCLARFASALNGLEVHASMRCSIAAELMYHLSVMPGIDSIHVAGGCQPAGYFASFRVRKRQTRDLVIRRLYKKGLFVSRTWEIVPAHYRCFAGTFPSGYATSEYLADHIVHIPTHLFSRHSQRRRLVQALGDLMSLCGNHA